MNSNLIVWNGCDSYVETDNAESRGHDFDGEYLYHGANKFHPFHVIEIDITILPADSDGDIDLSGIYATETGHYYVETITLREAITKIVL